MITREKAVKIAREDVKKAGINLAGYDIVSELGSDGWHVSYANKKTAKGGGGPDYLIDADTGEIISKNFQR